MCSESASYMRSTLPNILHEKFFAKCSILIVWQGSECACAVEGETILNLSLRTRSMILV